MALLEVYIQLFNQPRGTLIQLLLEARTAFLYMMKYGPHNRHDKRVLEVGTSKKGLCCLGIRCICIVPHTTVNGVHVVRLASDYPNRQAPTNSLAIGC